MQLLTNYLMVLHVINESDPERYTKSSLMLGPGGTEHDVIETMENMGSTKVSMLIIGQYWQPCSRRLPVNRYITSEQFNWFPEQQNKSDFPMSLQIRWLQAMYKAG